MEKIRQVPRDAAQQQGFNNYDLCVLNKKKSSKNVHNATQKEQISQKPGHSNASLLSVNFRRKF